MSTEGTKTTEKRKPAFPGTPWYDRYEGIVTSLSRLPDLLRLVAERNRAYYDRGERLSEFYVMGRYFLDSCGNCGVAMGTIPKEKFPEIPNVLTNDEFWSYIKERQESESNTMMYSFAMSGTALPEANVLCPVCGEGWTIENCHDLVSTHRTDTINLAEFVGQTLSEVKTAFAARTDASHWMQPDRLIQNDRFIDLSPKHLHPKNDWEKKRVVNGNGWVSKSDGVIDSYVIHDGDSALFNIRYYYHQVCNRTRLNSNEEQGFRKIFEAAGFRDIGMNRTPNQYCPCDVCATWFNVNTKFGSILVGWRKRVIVIDWKSMQETLVACGVMPEQGFHSLFTEEKVTKDGTMIHAWGWDKAQDYLTRIRKLLSPDIENL
ncbi:hypothetical protein HQ571_05605 [Candidatus Kuenenbacteria bacterium]|nr:hypothetical protein [Candidatus Kuenenbacteria bacterium]